MYRVYCLSHIEARLGRVQDTSWPSTVISVWWIPASIWHQSPISYLTRSRVWCCGLRLVWVTGYLLLPVLVWPTLHSSIGDRSFPIAAAHTWNSLPPSVTASQSLQTFRKRLKTKLFQRSYTTTSFPCLIFL